MPDESWKPPPDLRRCGLSAAVVRNGLINVSAWRRAEAEGGIVGTCRACGGYLVPDTPPTYGEELPVVWLQARCLSCSHEVASPGGRLARRPGAHQSPPRTRT